MKVAGATFIVAGGNPRPPALNDSPEIWLQAFKFQLIICVLSHNYFFDAWYELYFIKANAKLKRNKTRKAAEIHASRLTENEENLFSIQKGVSIKTRMLEKR